MVFAMLKVPVKTFIHLVYYIPSHESVFEKFTDLLPSFYLLWLWLMFH
jgi:hypothetical protein